MMDDGCDDVLPSWYTWTVHVVHASEDQRVTSVASPCTVVEIYRTILLDCAHSFHPFVVCTEPV
jgi:hypothetical protein